MAIEHLQFERPLPLDRNRSVFSIADQALADHARDIETLDPGLHDVTPLSEYYEELTASMQIAVHEDGTATQKVELTQADNFTLLHHPTQGFIQNKVPRLPDTFNPLSIIGPYRANRHREAAPHLFSILRWVSPEGEISYMPSASLIFPKATDQTRNEQKKFNTFAAKYLPPR